LGLVDELDDPGPGHLSKRPTPLSAVTSTTVPTLSERFVSESQSKFVAGGDNESKRRKDEQSSDPQTVQDEDKEVEAMVLDAPSSDNSI